MAGVGQNNPPWIIADTDALAQLIAADRLGPLKRLKNDYGIQTVVVEPVEVELRNVIRGSKFKDVQHILKKAFDTDLLTVLDQRAVQSLVGAHAPSVYQQIETEGLRLKSFGVGKGEAYTHASGMTLQMPVLSNDRKAIKILLDHSVSLQRPFLRSFDILVFGLQIGSLSHSDCDHARQSLIGKGRDP